MYSDINTIRAQYHCMQYIFRFKLNMYPFWEFSIFIQNTTFNDLAYYLTFYFKSYLNCVTSGERSGELCDIESYIASVKQTALIYRSSGLCPNLEIDKLDFDIEIDYQPRDEISAEYESEESDYSSDSESSQRRPVRSLENGKP